MNAGTLICLNRTRERKAKIEERRMLKSTGMRAHPCKFPLTITYVGVGMGFFGAHPMFGLVFVAHLLLSKLACYALYGGT